MNETDGQAAAPAPADTPKETRFAYHDGPPDIVFAGRTWRLGVSQPVTRAELRSMTRRAGWVLFDFRQT